MLGQNKVWVDLRFSQVDERYRAWLEVDGVETVVAVDKNRQVCLRAAREVLKGRVDHVT